MGYDQKRMIWYLMLFFAFEAWCKADISSVSLQGPHSRGGGGGVSDILDLKFWPKVIFLGLCKDARIFLGREINRGMFLGCKIRTKGFFGVC